MIDSRLERRRRRQLSGDNRAAVWVRRQNRAARLHVLRRNWRSVAGLLIVAAVLIVGVALLIPSPFSRGLFVGVGISVAVGTVVYMVLALSGTVPLGMGATAETWSASELRRLGKGGWSVVNGGRWKAATSTTCSSVPAA